MAPVSGGMGQGGLNTKDDPPNAVKKPDRKARLAEELRANLQRRKAQARARRTGGADERPDGLAAGRSAGVAENDNEPAGNEDES
jgi:hypothetical protein